MLTNFKNDTWIYDPTMPSPVHSRSSWTKTDSGTERTVHPEEYGILTYSTEVKFFHLDFTKKLNQFTGKASNNPAITDPRLQGAIMVT